MPEYAIEAPEYAVDPYAPQYDVVVPNLQANPLVEEFARLPDDVKFKVLRFAGQNASQFHGHPGEGKTRLFARVPHHIQKTAMDRALSEPVFLRRPGSADGRLSARQHEGKTSEFANLPPLDKLRVLECAGIDSGHFGGAQGEGKTALFASLPEDTKAFALKQASLGFKALGFTNRTRKYEGKTAQFARLRPDQKILVLHIAGLDVGSLSGNEHEGKTAAFAGLPEEVKQHALRQLAVNEITDEGDAMAQFASLSNDEKVYVLQLCGDFTPWAGINGEGKNGAFMEFPYHIQVRALVDAGLR